MEGKERVPGKKRFFFSEKHVNRGDDAAAAHGLVLMFAGTTRGISLRRLGEKWVNGKEGRKT